MLWQDDDVPYGDGGSTAASRGQRGLPDARRVLKALKLTDLEAADTPPRGKKP